MTRAAPARPLSLPDIVAAAFQIYVRQPLRFLVLAIPQAALTLILLLGLGAAFDALNLPAPNSGDTTPVADLGAALRLMLFVACFGLAGVTANAVADTFLFPAALRVVGRSPAGARGRRVALVGAALCAGLLIGSCVAVLLMAAFVLSPLGVLLVPLMVYLYVRWAFSVLVLSDAGGTPRAALRRSEGIVKGCWWRVALILAAIYALSLLPAIVGGAIGSASGSEAANLALGVIAVLIAAPFAAIARTLLYQDVLLRKGNALPPTAATS